MESWNSESTLMSWGKNALTLAGAIESIEVALRDGYNVYVFCASRRDGDVIAERFAEYAPVVYNSFTKGDSRCDAVLKNQCLPEGSRLFIGTSAAGVGISILDARARTIRVGGLTYGSRDASMGIQTNASGSRTTRHRMALCGLQLRLTDASP